MRNLRGTLYFLVLIAFVGLTALTQSNCGGEDEGPPINGIIVNPQPDTIPPATVVDLRTDAHTYQSMALVWTAPGDDRYDGTAASYDIRYSSSIITNDNWESATPIDSTRVPTPKPGRSIETIVILGLQSSSTYHFALKASDEEGNESSLSNRCSGVTEAEEFAPAEVTDLRAVAVTDTSFELTWTATGDDFNLGTAARYEIRYWIRPITTEAEWNGASAVADPPTPKPAGEKESFVATVAFNQNYFFALKVVDETDNSSGLSNLATGLKLGEILWIYPTSIPIGATMYVTFKGSETDITRISLQETFQWWEDITCGDRVVVDLFRGSLPGGVHMIEFKFWDEENQRYLPTDTYHISICYGPNMMLYPYVSLYN